MNPLPPNWREGLHKAPSSPQQSNVTGCGKQNGREAFGKVRGRVWLQPEHQGRDRARGIRDGAPLDSTGSSGLKAHHVQTLLLNSLQSPATCASSGFPPKGAASPTPDIPTEESAPISTLLDLMAVNCGREHIWPLRLSFYASVMKMTFTYSLYRAVEEIDQAAHISCFL